MVRWNKVFREIWLNFGRSMLVIISIAIGVAAIGVVLSTQKTLSSEIPASYAQINPASADLTISPFNDDLVRVIRKLPDVAAAESRRVITARLMTAPDTWRSINLYVIPDFNNIQINKIVSAQGKWPPSDRELMIERSSILLTGAISGDTVTIQTADGKQRNLKISGLAYDMSQPSAALVDQINGYITFNTLEWLGYTKTYNELLIVTRSGTSDLAQIQKMAVEVRDRVEKSGYTVYWTTLTDPQQYWFQQYLTPMAAILGALGILSLILSCFLVINTISALLAQQIHQIGIMKAVGARRSQIIGIYIVMVLVFGALALILAIPLSKLGARYSLQILSGLINIDTPTLQYSQSLIITQAILSLLLPAAVSLVPVLSGTRITVREAITHTGLSVSQFGTSTLDRIIGGLSGLPRPLMLSLRNTFRKKTRLLLTLITLTIASAIFIAVISVQSSLEVALDQTLKYYNFDILVSFEQPYRSEQIQAATQQIATVQSSETWGVVNVHRVLTGGTEGDNIILAAPPVGTQMIRPSVIQGRWLVPEDENAIVINADVVHDNPDLHVGSEVILNIEGEKISWTVVGIVKSAMFGSWAYTNYPYFSYRLNKAGQAGTVYISTRQHDNAYLTNTMHQLEEEYKRIGLHVSATTLVSDLRQIAISQFNVIIDFLLIMAILIALIGGLGLTGTMSLNVIERSREIGLMRAIGARNHTILQIVLVEGAVIGFISWVFGAMLAYPLGAFLNNLIGTSFLRTPIDFVYAFNGAAIWLIIALILSSIASLIPAVHANHLTIREVLAYE